MLLAQWFAPRRSTAVRIVSRELENQQALLERFFEEAAADHGNMRGRHKRYAATYLGMINTYIGLAQRSYATIGDSLVHDAVHQFMHGIFS
jgi:TetR/AcrR family transcriptional regulator